MAGRLLLIEAALREERLERKRNRRRLRNQLNISHIPDLEFVGNYRLSRELFEELCQDILSCRGHHRYFKLSRKNSMCFVTAAVGCNIIGHGSAIGYPAVLLPQLQRPGSEIKLDAASVSWIASILGVTQLLGSFLTPPIMGRCGRRAAHLAVAVPGLAGWLLLAMASSYEELIFARILSGLSVGMLSPLRSALIGEYSSPKHRGALLTTVSLTQSFGLFFVHLIGSLLSWQQTAIVIAFFPFVSIIMTLYSPESPSWLADKGRYEECRRVFRWLRGPTEEEELNELINAQIIEKTAQKENRLKAIKSTVMKKEFYKPITLMAHAYITSNFCGATVMAAYSTVVISLVFGPDTNAHFWMILLDTQRLIFNSIAVFVINRYKRRTMMFTTGSLSVFSQLAIALYVYFKSKGILSYDGMWLPALLINLQFFAIATGILPLPNVIGGEVFPLEYRSIGGSISLTALSATFFLVLKTFPGLIERFGLHGAYMFHTGVLAYCFVVIWFLQPETKGKTLQQIEDEFRGRRVVNEEALVLKIKKESPEE